MLEQAALANSASTPVQMPDQKETDFIGEFCDGLKTCIGHLRRDIQKPEEVRNEDVNTSLDISHASDEREEIPHHLAYSSTVSISGTKAQKRLVAVMK